MKKRIIPGDKLEGFSNLKFISKNTVYFKVFVNYALMTISITTLLGVIFYFIFSSTFVDEVSNANRSLLETESRVMNEKFVDYVRSFTLKLTMDSEWNSLHYFFSYATRRNYDVNSINSAYLYLKSKISSNWETLDSINVYFDSINMLLSSNSGLTFLDSGDPQYGFAKEIFKIMREKNASEFWSETTTIRETASPEKKVIYYSRLYPYGAEPSEAKGCVIVAMNQRALEGVIRLSSKELGSAYIINEESSIIAYSPGRGALSDEGSHKLLKEYKNHNEFKDSVIDDINGKRIIISSVVLSNGNWRLVRITPMEIWYYKVNLVKYILIATCILFIIIGMLLSRFTLTRIHNPLQRIISYIKDMPKGLENLPVTKDADEYTILGNTIVGLSKKVSEFEHVFSGNMEMLKSNFLEYILFNSTDDINDLYELMKLVSIKMPYCHFGVILIDLPPGDYSDKLPGESRISAHRLIDFIETDRQPGFICYGVNIPSYCTGRYISIVFNSEKEDRVWLMEKVENIYTRLTEYYKLNLKASVGRVVEHLGNVQSSRQDAEVLIKYAYFNIGKGGVIGDLEVLRREQSCTVIPEELFDRYEKALKRLEVPVVQKTVKYIVEEMKNRNYSEALCRAKLGKMVDAFVKRLENCSGYNYDSKKSYNEIMNSDSIDELQERLFEELENTFEYVQYEKTRESSIMIKKVPELVRMAKEYTVRNLEKDVSLYAVSEYIGVSPQYFSKIFKEETGENYMDFLTLERMERAKKIIRESSEISIEELYNKVGYSSASYFIKKFKETYNMTPNTFRKIVKNEFNSEKM